MLKTSIPQAWWWWRQHMDWLWLWIEKILWWDYIPQKPFICLVLGRLKSQNQLKFGTSGEPIPSEPWNSNLRRGEYNSPVTTVIFWSISLGEILLVEKLMNLVSRRFYCDIHKWKVNDHNEWEKVESLQGRALVLSEYRTAAMSLSTVDFPKLEANSIYEA